MSDIIPMFGIVLGAVFGKNYSVTHNNYVRQSNSARRLRRVKRKSKPEEYGKMYDINIISQQKVIVNGTQKKMPLCAQKLSAK
ncbi:MAG: hypothetical protein ACI4RO_02905 [Candidatus Scatosoma sp.]